MLFFSLLPSINSKKFILKISSIFLALSAIFALTSSNRYASKNNPAFKKSVFSKKTDLKQSWSESFEGGKIYFGKNLEWFIAGRLQNGKDSAENFELDTSESPGSDTAVLYLSKGIENIKFNKELCKSKTHRKKDPGDKRATYFANSWKFSDIREYLNSNLPGKNMSKFEEDYLTDYERNAVLKSKIDTNVFKGRIVQKDKTEDKYYLPSGIWNTEFLSWGANDISDSIPMDLSESSLPRNISVPYDISKYLIPAEYFTKGKANSALSSGWARSPYSNSEKTCLVSSRSAGLVFALAADGSTDKDSPPSCAPICKLNIENLNFASYASMFNSNDSITKIPSGNGLYLKNKAEENDFEGHTVNLHKGILSYGGQHNASPNCFLCLLLKDNLGNSYSASYELSCYSKKEIDISKYESGYYWFEKESQPGSRNVVAGNPSCIDAQINDLSYFPTGNRDFHPALLFLSGFGLSALTYCLSVMKTTRSREYEKESK